MKCSNCKGRNKQEAKFCRHCGEELNSKEEVKESKSYKGKVIYGLLMVTVLIITFVASYMLVSSLTKDGGGVNENVIMKK